MEREWVKVQSSKPYVKIEGAIDCIVRSDPLSKGYLWQVGPVFGYEQTLESAKQTAEDCLAMQEALRKVGAGPMPMVIIIKRE